MTTPNDQFFESFLPIYDAIPDTWDDAKVLITERFRQIANAVNAREIGFFLDDELLSGKSFIPGVTIPGNNPGEFRTVLRKVIDFGPIAAGINSRVHDILFDANFTLIQLWACATNSSTFLATTFANSDTIAINATNVNVLSNGTYDRCFVFIEYIQEL